MPVVYIDILLAVNWLADTLLLSAVSRILQIVSKRSRLVLGGLVGGAAAVGVFLIPLPTGFVVFLHGVIAVLIILLAFGFESLRILLKRVVVLYCLSSLFSGVMSALGKLTGSEFLCARNGIVYVDISPLMLALLAVSSYAVLCLYDYLTRKRVPTTHEYELLIEDGNGVLTCRALYDTGMHVREPFSGKPVVIAETSVVAPYIRPELYRSLCRPDCTASTSHRVRMIPYRSIGGDGLLPSFVPKRMQIRSPDGQTTDISGTYLALTNDIQHGEFQALIGHTKG